jgi:ribonuclease P protein component
MMRSRSMPPPGALRKTREYRRVYTSARPIKGEYCRLYLAPASPRPCLSARQEAAALTQRPGAARPCVRLGISVSKSVAKKAVQRSRVKRIIRSWFRAEALPCRTQGRKDIIVVVKKLPQLGRGGSRALRRELNQLLAKSVAPHNGRGRI